MKLSKLAFFLIVNFFISYIAYSGELNLKKDYSTRQDVGCLVKNVLNIQNRQDKLEFFLKNYTLFEKKPLEWNDKDIEILKNYIKEGFRKKDSGWDSLPKEKELDLFINILKKVQVKIKEDEKRIQLIRQQKEKEREELEKIIEPVNYDGLWNCDGILLALNISGNQYYDRNIVSGELYYTNKRCIAMSGYEDIYDLENIAWNEKEGKAIIEFKLTKGLSGIFSKNTVWNLSLENKKKTLVVKTQTETFFYKKVGNIPSYGLAIKRVIPDYVKKLDKEF